jgi:glyoxylase-like metal-dependent hydrolase (beta-lactamase superfamily II)
MRAHVHHVFDDRTNTLTYVVWHPGTLDAVIIDPVLDYDPVGSHTWTASVDGILELVRTHGLHVHYVLETHAHADHLSGSQPLRRALDAKLAIGERIVQVQETFQRLFDLPPSFHVDGRQFDRLLRDEDHLRAGALSIEVIATPGHTPACVTYKIGDAVFTGDALFMDDYGTGRCDFPGGSADALFTSIQRLYLLPDDTRVFVGHDYLPNGRALRWETTIGASKRTNAQLNATTSREAFVWLRNQRDATLAAPRLLFQSVQVNVAGGHLPEPGANGVRYFKLPLNLFRPADELGRPIGGNAEPEPC